MKTEEQWNVIKAETSGNMPAMIRPKTSVSVKIAYKVLGKPANISNKKSALLKKIDEQLVFQNTARVR